MYLSFMSLNMLSVNSAVVFTVEWYLPKPHCRMFSMLCSTSYSLICRRYSFSITSPCSLDIGELESRRGACRVCRRSVEGAPRDPYCHVSRRRITCCSVGHLGVCLYNDLLNALCDSGSRSRLNR